MRNVNSSEVAFCPRGCCSVFKLSIPETRLGEFLEVTAFDVAGRRVSQVHRGVASEPSVTVAWDAAESGRVMAGVYVIRFRLGHEQWARPVVVLK